MGQNEQKGNGGLIVQTSSLTDAGADCWENVALTQTRDQAPALSICVPFFRFDVGQLADCLIQQSQAFYASLELIFADDGSHDSNSISTLRAKFEGGAAPATLLVFERNQGRSIIRNCLVSRARGRYILFLDSDMLPDGADFVASYLGIAVQGREDVVVGGCSYKQVLAVSKAQLLYYYHSSRSQCLPLSTRQQAPIRYMFTNNVMIRTALLKQLSFDVGYVGWGYEDTDWTIRAARSGARIMHIDNTASHLGLINDDSVIDKYRNSAANFLRLTRKFPSETAGFPVSKAVRWLSWMPLPFALLAKLFEQFTRIQFLPVRLRYVCLQCFKALLYCGTFRKASDRDAVSCRT